MVIILLSHIAKISEIYFKDLVTVITCQMLPDMHKIWFVHASALYNVKIV